MNSSGKRDFDLFDNYIGPGKIKKAPEGFTERVMMQVGMENVSVRLHRRSGSVVIIPVIAFVTTMALIIIAGLTTSTGSLFLNSVSQLLSDIKILIPLINLDKISGFTLPGIIFYIAIGILFLSLFDFALNRIFRKREQ